MTIVLNTTIRPEVLRGRGAVSNAVGRYEKQTRVLLDDGWDDGWRADDDAPPPIKTEVIHDATRSIITRNKSPDISFDQSINPYRGCEHGCIYCFARPTHAYLGMSPGVDFESRLFAKPNAAALLAKELSAPGYVPKVIAMGTNTDPYQPLEKKMRITRSHPGSAARLPPSRRHRHQIAADPARPRYPVGDGGDGPGQGGAVDHHPGPQAGARDGAARRNAGAAAAGHSGPGRCRRARRA